MEHWAEQWQKYPHCRQTKNFYPTPDKNLHQKTRKLSRSAMTTLVQIITGQNNLNYLTNIIFPQLTDQCRFCEEEQETFIHLLNECPVFRDKRNNLFKGNVIENSLDWDPAVLVEFARHPPIEEALASRSNE